MTAAVLVIVTTGLASAAVERAVLYVYVVARLLTAIAVGVRVTPADAAIAEPHVTYG